MKQEQIVGGTLSYSSYLTNKNTHLRLYSIGHWWINYSRGPYATFNEDVISEYLIKKQFTICYLKKNHQVHVNHDPNFLTCEHICLGVEGSLKWYTTKKVNRNFSGIEHMINFSFSSWAFLCFLIFLQWTHYL